MAKIIILIGKTGSGKSTLANVISNTNKFKESIGSVSETKEIQKEEFIESGISYAVIDTVGIGDTKLKKEEVLDKIAEAVYLARDGISQILFITSGRFDQFEMSTYNLLRTIIFDENATDHTTIVRTKFEDFEDEEECQTDIEKMLSEKELSEIVSSCQESIIHVNNSSLSSKYGKEERDESRKKVLEHLWEKCQNKEEYKPQKLQDLSTEILVYMEEKISKREELAEKERQRRELEEKEAKEKQTSTLENVENEAEIVFTKDSKNNENKDKEAAIQQKVDLKQPEQNSENNGKLLTKLNISALENELKELEETKKLIEDIQQKDGLIRQVIFRHIFNNINDISQVTGADFFLNSIVNDNDNSASKLNIAELREKRKELEAKLLEKKDNDQSLEEIRSEIEKKEQELLDLKKQLLSNEEVLAKWQERGFSIDQAQEWADILKSTFDPENDASFCAWLRDDKELTAQEVQHQSNLESLKKEYQPMDQKEKTSIAQHFQQDFDKWTSGNEEIDKFIQKYQLAATNYRQILEWIPYEQFKDIEYLTEGGFGKVYKAKWMGGNIHHWDAENKQWQREKDNNERERQQLTEQISSVESKINNNESSEANKSLLKELQTKLKELPEYKNYREIVLKSLTNSQDNTDFLQEVAKHKDIDDWSNNIVPCYGISQEPQGDYLMVMDYVRGGNLREHLQKNNQLDLKRKLIQLSSIVEGLKAIHDQGLIHKDFHSGNILNSDIRSFITDLGLSKPANEKDSDNIYGALPYVAPEVLQGEPYTKESDIYSFGIIAYELLANSYPYADLELSETRLAVEICKGLRPDLDKVPIPQELKDLIKSCWNADPEKRPSARETKLTLKKGVGGLKEVKKDLEINLVESEAKIQRLKNELIGAKARAEERQKKVDELSKKHSLEKIVRTPINKKTINFLRAKSTFLNARQETISELKKCFIVLENKFGKYDKIGEVGDMVSGIGGSLPSIVTFGIPEIVGEAIQAGNSFSKIMIEKKSNKNFEISLRDETELFQLNSAYDALLELEEFEIDSDTNILSLKDRSRIGKSRVFNTDYEIFAILETDGVWKNRSLTPEKMETAIKSLSENHKKLEEEWEEQFAKLKTELGKKRASLFARKQQKQAQIRQLKKQLEDLKGSVKHKLKSKYPWSSEEKEKRNEERETTLNDLLKVQAEIARFGGTTDKQSKLTALQHELLEIAKEHKDKDFKTELDNFCQVQIDLTNLQIELEDLQNKHQKGQILSPTEEKTDSFQEQQIPPKN